MKLIYFIPFILLFISLYFTRIINTKECYRCRNAQTFSTNLTTSLFPLSKGKPCILEIVECSDSENSCVYGLVSVIVAGGYWFHLSGCYVEPVNQTHCYRGVGPVHWPGYTAELRANYCLCSGPSDTDLCNDNKFAKSVLLSNFHSKNSKEGSPMPIEVNGSTNTKQKDKVEKANGQRERIIERKRTNGGMGRYFWIDRWMCVIWTIGIIRWVIKLVM